MKPERTRRTAPAPILDLERFLPYRLSVLSNTVSHAIAEMYGERYQLSVTQWRVLAVVGRFPDLSAVEVAERTKMDKVAVSRAVAELIRDGRLDRSVDRKDRRRSVLNLSTDGRSVYNEVAPLALACEARLQSVLSSSERTALERILDKLTTAGVAMLLTGEDLGMNPRKVRAKP
ncbi:MAG: MarR family winged helix-turn-helix transcriptional regulator [Lysobacterales bacterium]|nr:winged helix-turn-helix transcriptional regulator [Xanthomonadales bacterium]